MLPHDALELGLGGITGEEAAESFDLLYTGRGLPLDAVVERPAGTAERALMTP